MKLLIFSVFATAHMVTAHAAAVIDPADVGYGDGDWRSIVMGMGFFAAIQCHQHKDLIRWGKVTENIDGCCKWIFRAGVVLLLAHLVFHWFGRHVDMDEAGWMLLGIWLILRTAQAIYVSGVSYGIHNSSEISRRVQEPRSLD
jgi:hypothetical protein